MVIFLDIDGVLNSTEWAAERPLRALIPPRCAQEALDEERIDPRCVEYLRRVIQRTGARLVVTSTWRQRIGVSEFVQLFALYGWNEAPVIGVTPYIAGLIRGDEVHAWLANNDFSGRYVCLDDDDDFRVGQPLVRTDREVGMTSLDAALCVELLTSTKTSR
jgi:HAD domain in Swiss Army Knife RNA repair proteins